MFVIDTNVIIQGHENYYPSENFPSFWEWVIVECQKGNLIFIDQVIDESTQNKKALQYSWVQNNKGILQQNYHWCDKVENSERRNTEIIMSGEGDYLQAFFKDKENHRHQRYKDAFLSGADFYLIAYAQAHNLTVVTYENNDSKNRKKILIPNYCGQEKIKCCHPKHMFSILGLTV